MDYNILAERLIELYSSTYQIQVDRALSKLVQGELFVLNYLYSHNGVAYPKELSCAMAVTTARIAKVLNELESDSLICRTVDPDDNRQIIVNLTDKGVVRIEEKHNAFLHLIARSLEQLGAPDAEEYIRIKKKLTENVYNEMTSI